MELSAYSAMSVEEKGTLSQRELLTVFVGARDNALASLKIAQDAISVLNGEGEASETVIENGIKISSGRKEFKVTPEAFAEIYAAIGGMIKKKVGGGETGSSDREIRYELVSVEQDGSIRKVVDKDGHDCVFANVKKTLSGNKYDHLAAKLFPRLAIRDMKSGDLVVKPGEMQRGERAVGRAKKPAA
jgi:hypothetical protein